MFPISENRLRFQSPSTRREWIEIRLLRMSSALVVSPSTRREWIEISDGITLAAEDAVSLHTEGVD